MRKCCALDQSFSIDFIHPLRICSALFYARPFIFRLWFSSLVFCSVSEILHRLESILNGFIVNTKEHFQVNDLIQLLAKPFVLHQNLAISLRMLKILIRKHDVKV